MPGEVFEVIALENVPSSDLVFMDLPGDPTYMALAHDNIQFARPTDPGPITWTAIGGAMLPGTAEHSIDLDRQGQEVQFNATDPDKAFAPKFLSLNMFGRRYEHWRVYWWDSGPDAGRVRAARMVFGGYLNGKFDVEDEVDAEGFRTGTVTVTFRALAPFAIGDIRGSIQTNLRSHQRLYPGDVGMDQVQDVMNRKIFFGVPSGTGYGGPDDYMRA